MSNVYIVPESILLLVKIAAARVILDDWLDGVESDIRIRRAKTAGHVVIETHDVLFATRIRRLCPECKVHMR